MTPSPGTTSPARPSQRDIARAAGVTQATVSLALSNHPRLSTEIRERIKTIAQQLGYQPDPYLAGLSAYRKQRRPTAYQATLAWLTNFPDEDRDWRSISTFLHYYEGATQRAAELGYQIEEHNLAQNGMTPSRMERILTTRNIPGLLVAPQPHPGITLDFPLARFSCVTIGYTLAAPRLHMVTNHAYRSADLLLTRLLERGYQRLGFVMEAEDELRIKRIFSSAFLRFQQDLPLPHRIPLLEKQNLNRDDFLHWYRLHKPDAIVTLWDLVYPWLHDAGIRIPEDTALALLSVREPTDTFSGIWGNPCLVGARAVEHLIDLVHRGERGIPESPSCLLVEGSWHEGKTIHPQ
ncbi:LacI family transcriptional regulator [Opitutaceae bacterium TAV4]|nr:LacI family transcriptional regulator [Opitutaceae bacterium TAV4]